MNDCCAAFAGFPFSRMMSTTCRTFFASNGGTGLRGCGSGVSVAQFALSPAIRRRGSRLLTRPRRRALLRSMRRNAGDLAAAVCAAAFVIVLAVSAVWDRSIRVLHVVEALPYIV